jgi:hypothetical protein
MPGNDIMLAWRKDRQHARNVVRDMLPKALQGRG